MKKLIMILAMAVAALAVWHLRAQATQGPGFAGAPFKKVMVVIFENESEEDAIKLPFFQAFAQHGALLANYHALGHPSYPNYLGMVAGTTFNIHTDFQRTIDSDHLGDLLEAKGHTWRVYAEDYPGTPGDCYLGSSSDRYVRRHVPFLSFRNVHDTPRCGNVVNANQLPVDIANGQLADYSLYVPNLDNDGHDTNLEYADHWFSTAFGPLIQDRRFMDGMLLVATFDEDDNHHGNVIYTALYGDGIVPGTISRDPYTHYDLLRTIEEGFGLGSLGRGDGAGRRITGVWR